MPKRLSGKPPQVWGPEVLFQQHCKVTQQWGIYFAFCDFERTEEELLHYIPFLRKRDMETVAGGYGFLFFSDEATMEKYFKKIANVPRGPIEYLPVFVQSCSPDGNFLKNNDSSA